METEEKAITVLKHWKPKGLKGIKCPGGCKLKFIKTRTDQKMCIKCWGRLTRDKRIWFFNWNVIQERVIRNLMTNTCSLCKEKQKNSKELEKHITAHIDKSYKNEVLAFQETQKAEALYKKLFNKKWYTEYLEDCF